MMKLMKRSDNIISAQIMYLLAALSIVGISLWSLQSVGSSSVYEQNVKARSESISDPKYASGWQKRFIEKYVKPAAIFGINPAMLEAEGWRLSGDADMRMPASTRMAVMDLSTSKRFDEVGAKTFAQSSESNDAMSEVKKKAVGCYVNNVWHPEGAIYPPQEPGRMTLTVVTYVCRGGKWVIRRKAD